MEGETDGKNEGQTTENMKRQMEGQTGDEAEGNQDTHRDRQMVEEGRGMCHGRSEAPPTFGAILLTISEMSTRPPRCLWPLLPATTPEVSYLFCYIGPMLKTFLVI